MTIQQLQDEIGKTSKTEDKIQVCLKFMKEAIADYKSPRFKEFWECKPICLALFKQPVASTVRGPLWNEYIEVAKEARHLKESFDKESSFALEQIELAITAIEKDLDNWQELAKQMSILPHLDQCQALKKNRDFYFQNQGELSLLNTFASKVNSLRKEVVKTDMRIRFKNKLFDRLSKLGDRIFPRRKELIVSISGVFTTDVEAFIQANFKLTSQEKPAFLRDEIRDLQSVAKELTLDTPTFTNCRVQLSQSWDALKIKDEEEKVKQGMANEQAQKNMKVVQDRIKLLAEKCKDAFYTLEEAAKLSSEIMTFMKGLELGRDGTRLLKDELQKAKQPLYDRIEEELQHREKVFIEAEKLKRARVTLVRKEIEGVVARQNDMSLDEVKTFRDKTAALLKELSLTPGERELIDGLMKQLRDSINEKREVELHLDPGALSSLETLRAVLDNRKSQRHEIKAHIDEFKKELSGSGFDFEKAMRYGELIDAEKAKLGKVDEAIEELEDKIADIEE